MLLHGVARGVRNVGTHSDTISDSGGLREAPTPLQIHFVMLQSSKMMGRASLCVVKSHHQVSKHISTTRNWMGRWGVGSGRSRAKPRFILSSNFHRDLWLDRAVHCLSLWPSGPCHHNCMDLCVRPDRANAPRCILPSPSLVTCQCGCQTIAMLHIRQAHGGLHCIEVRNELEEAVDVKHVAHFAKCSLLRTCYQCNHRRWAFAVCGTLLPDDPVLEISD